MKSQVVLLESAEQDLKDLKSYIVKQFGKKAWLVSYRGIKDTVRALKSFPLAGSIPEEISDFNLSQFRQVLSGRNRIIYETRQGTVFVHIICDTRKDLRALLIRRSKRAP